MVDTVTSQTLNDGPRNAVMKFTNISDATGEAAVTKVDVSALSGAPTSVVIEKIEYSTRGMGVNILWDATADVLAYALEADGGGMLDFTSFGGISNSSGAGKTGDINFTTQGATAGDSYSVVLHMKKKYA